MTDEQRKLVEDNHNLIYSFLHKYKRSTDEWYDMAAVGLCTAALSYNAKGCACRGTQKSKRGKKGSYGDNAAELASKLNLTPTTKIVNGANVQMVGFPVSSLDNYRNTLGGGYTITVSDTPTVTNITEQNMSVTDENAPVNGDVTNTDVDTAEGEILSLKHTKNTYALSRLW